MQKFAKLGGLLALGLTIVPPIIVLVQSLNSPGPEPATTGLTEAMMKHLMLAGTVLWFVAAPLWLKEE